MRGLIGAVVVAVAVVLQLAVADRITFPGGTGPDLVLLTVAALALAIGPMAGAILGFCAGLALDVAPPAGHLVGQDALVFCLIGYVCGLASSGPAAEGLPEQERSALVELGVTAAGAVCGEVMIAGLGVMLSDPRVTWPAIKHVLPVAAGYDLLLSPFVLFTVAAMLRVAGFVSPRDTSPGIATRPAAWAAGAASAGAIRQLAGSGSPRLRLSGQGKGADGWLNGGHGGNRSGPGRSGLSGPGNSRPGAGRREPRLKLGGSGTGHGPGGSRRGPAGAGSGSSRVKFGGGRRGEGVVGGSLLGGLRSSGGMRGSGGPVGFRRAGDRLASSRLGASLLGGSVFGRSSSVFGRPVSPFGRTSAAFSGSSANGFTGRSLRGLSKSRGPAKSNGTAAHAPRFRGASTMGRMVNGARRPGQRKSPGKNWLRGSRPGRGPVRSLAGRRSPSRGWLRGMRGSTGSGGTVGLGGKKAFGGRSALGGKSGLSGKSAFGSKSKNAFGKKNAFGAKGPSRLRLRRRRTGGYR